MSFLAVSPTEALACGVHFDKERVHIQLLDGRTISVPLEWFPKLRDATGPQKKNWRFIGKGVGVHWKDLEEDISIAALL